VLTNEVHQVQYYIEAPGLGIYHNGTISGDSAVKLNFIGAIEVASSSDQDKGIYLTTSSDKVTVIGQSLRPYSSDSFFALPITVLDNIPYVYYGISVPRNTIHTSTYYSSILIVGTENNTMMTLRVTQSVSISVGTTTTNLIPGVEYSFVINRFQTIYVRSLEDLTGTKIITDRPVSVFSGHQCANVPRHVRYCSYLVEQIPPTIVWGKVFYTAPLANKTFYTIKVLAAYNTTTVSIYCNDVNELQSIDEGQFVDKVLSTREYCAINSNKKVLVVQFSHGADEDNNYGDPMMTLVPATNQYLNKFDFSTIRVPLTLGYAHYVNIIVTAQYYQPNMIYLIAGGVNRSLVTEQWVPIQANGITEAYATQVNISEGINEISHSNAAAQMITIVYGFDLTDGYGHVGGIHISTGC